MKYLFNFLLCIQLLQYSLSIPIDLVNTLPVKITCDNNFKLYHNGIMVGSGNSWQTTYSYNVKLSPTENVFALEGVNTGGPAGFIGIFGEKSTMPINWRCKDFGKPVQLSNWTSVNFDDTAWPVAVSYGKNNNLNIWKTRPNIPVDAEWLWTNNNKNHDLIYCRYKLLNKPNIQLLPEINKTIINKVIEKPKENELEYKTEVSIETLINYHNESNVKLRELEEKITKILHETQKKYEEDIKINENNIKITNSTLNTIINKKTVITTNIRILHEKIIKLNISIHDHYKQMHEDTEYLKRLTILKPKFLKTLDNVNKQLGLVKSYISDTLVEGEDKNGLLRIIFDLHNSTKYTTIDISHAFLVHYEKYKNRISGNSHQYQEEISKLEKYQTTYSLYLKEKKDIVNEYKKVVEIIRKLRETYDISIDEEDLFNELIIRISGLLKNNNCDVKSYISPELEKECSTTLLKSHIENDHI